MVNTARAKPTPVTPKVHVVLDTNALFTELADKLIALDLSNLILTEIPPLGIEVSWHIPATVKAERRRQMLERGSGLLIPLGKLEALLGHKLGISADNLGLHVDDAIQRQMAEHRLQEITVDYAKVDWSGLVERAVQRHPPFSPSNEKGFKDAIILEAFSQLVDSLPKSPRTCRAFLLTNDELLAEAARQRTGQRINANVVGDLNQLRTVLNAIAAHLGQEALDKLLPKAKKMFFDEATKDGLYYKWQISKPLHTERVTAPPEPGYAVKVDEILISSPTFLGKTGQRIDFSTTITMKMTATKLVRREAETSEPAATRPPEPNMKLAPRLMSKTGNFGLGTEWSKYLKESLASFGGPYDEIKVAGSHIVHVKWHVTLNSKGSLVSPGFDALEHIAHAWDKDG